MGNLLELFYQPFSLNLPSEITKKMIKKIIFIFVSSRSEFLSFILKGGTKGEKSYKI